MASETPLLSSVQMNEIDTDDHAGSNIQNSIDKIATQQILEISAKNTILHQLFGDKFGEKIMNLLFNRYTLSIIGLMLMIWFILSCLFFTNVLSGDIMHFTYCTIIYAIIFMYLFLLLLSLNKTTTKLILRTLEFWLKMEFLCQFLICHSLCEEYRTAREIFLHVFYNMVVFICVLVFCLIDGSKMSYRVKAILFFLGGLLFTIGSFYWTVMYTETHIIAITLLGNYSFNIDVREWTASSIRLLTIFTWKQTIYSIFKAPKSSIIIVPVSIKWL